MIKLTQSIFLFSFFFFAAFSACTSKSKHPTLAKDETKITNISITGSQKSQITNDSVSLKILTWNIKDLGKTKDANEIYQIAQIIRDYDIVAIQEVVAKDPAGAQAVAKIADELNRMGSKWDYSISDPTKSPSVYISERYAFLWKTSKTSLIGKPHLDQELENLIDREPYIAKFIFKNTPFYLVNIHCKVYNNNPQEEIILLKDYPKRLNSNRIIICGDFNLNENHSVWDVFYAQGYKPALKNTPTTLKTKCKSNNYFNYPIDNIYYNTPKIKMINSGRLDFVKGCENLVNARNISDHLPVFMEFYMN